MNSTKTEGAMILRNGKLQKLVGITDIMSFEKIIWKELRDPEKKGMLKGTKNLGRQNQKMKRIKKD
jgi:hypothetical protein